MRFSGRRQASAAVRKTRQAQGDDDLPYEDSPLLLPDLSLPDFSLREDFPPSDFEAPLLLEPLVPPVPLVPDDAPVSSPLR